MNTQLMYGEFGPDPSRPRAQRRSGLTPHGMMVCLAACMALQMTSFVIILPLFARRFTQIGAGVGALGASEMAFALAATVTAPLMGTLADRFGRRPILLVSLVVYVLAFTGYLLASSAVAFIVLRGLAGALTAGLVPAAIGVVADLAPSDRRAQWIAIMSAGSSFGWIAGPVLGGLLYDNWGYEVALIVSIGMETAAFLLALLTLRETHKPAVERSSATASPNAPFRFPDLTASLAPVAAVLFIYFAVMFAWAFMEPRFMFYAYEDLGWSSSVLGLMMSVFGITMMAGELGLGRLSDKLGRKPVIVVGLVLFSAQFLGLAFFRDHIWIALAFAIAGLGNAIFDPALSASILDSAPSGSQARLLGVRSTVGSLANIAGPGLAVLLVPILHVQGVVLASSGVVLAAVLVALSVRGRAKARAVNLRSSMAGTQAD